MTTHNTQTTLLPIKTRKFLAPKDRVFDELLRCVSPLERGDVLVVASKIVAIDQGRTVAKSDRLSKEELIVKESQAYIPSASHAFNITLSITNGILIPSAGIDESNAGDYYILWPSFPSAWAAELRSALMKRDGIKELGVIVADSHLTPLRWGTTGICIGCAGFEPLKNYQGTSDLYNSELKYTKAGLADAIAAAAVGLMGEGDESTPVCLVRGWPNLTFTDESHHYQELAISPEEDIFAPLYTGFIPV